MILVQQLIIKNNFFFYFCSSPCYSACRFNKIRLTPSKIHWDGPGWFECFTENKPCKQVCARTPVSRACMPHGLQCLRVRGACCPSLLKQLVIWVVVERTHRHRNLLFQLDVHWNVPGWYECSTENKPCKQVCARTPVSRACLAHGLQCLRVRGACCPSLPMQVTASVEILENDKITSCLGSDGQHAPRTHKHCPGTQVYTHVVLY